MRVSHFRLGLLGRSAWRILVRQNRPAGQPGKRNRQTRHINCFGKRAFKLHDDPSQGLATGLHLNCRGGSRRTGSGILCICGAGKLEEKSMQLPRFVSRLAFFAVAFGLMLAAALWAGTPSGGPMSAAPPGANDPWTAAHVVQPADLAREIAEKKATSPTVLYVGFRTLFAGGHIA